VLLFYTYDCNYLAHGDIHLVVIVTSGWRVLRWVHEVLPEWLTALRHHFKVCNTVL
jgi:hypothetical protein